MTCSFTSVGTRRGLLPTVLVLLTVVGFSLSGCSAIHADDDLLDRITKGRVTIGTKYDQPGLAIRHPDNTMSGLDVDIATYVVNYIADTHGLERPTITWRETPSVQRETLLQNGEVDFVAATYSINSGRQESVNFAGPYLLTHQALLVRISDDINDAKDLEGRTLCSVTGSTAAQTAKKEIKNVLLQEYDAYSSCVDALRRGQVDALTTDATILSGYAAQSPGQFRLVSLLDDNGKELTDEYYGIGLPKDDRRAQQEVNTALKYLLTSGKWDKLIEKHVGTHEGITKPAVGDLSIPDAS